MPASDNIDDRRRWIDHRSDANREQRWSPRRTITERETSAGRRWSSRQLHRLGAVTSHAWSGVTVAVLLMAWIVVGILDGFDSRWQAILACSTSAVTVVMVFALQHMQGREQSVVQRKLDEILRVLPGADNRLISAEDASDDELIALGALNQSDRKVAHRRNETERSA